MAEPRVPVRAAKHRGSILQIVVQAENQVEDNVASGEEGRLGCLSRTG